MGNDGGSIPTRRELVKEAARNPTTTQLKETQHEQQDYFWNTDPLSRQPLATPVVSDSNGKLYNKDAVLEHLLSPDSSPEAESVLSGAVTSLKDVVELHFTIDPAGADASAIRREVWRCPVTNAALGPGTKAAYLVPCGHVFSGAAIKEVLVPALIDGDIPGITEPPTDKDISTTTDPARHGQCVVCDHPFAENDIIPILPTSEEDVARLTLRTRSLRTRGLSHSLKSAKSKKDKKRKKRSGEEDSALAAAAEDDGAEAPKLVKARKLDTKETSGPAAASGINNSGTAALTQKVLEEQEAKKRARLAATGSVGGANDNIKSLFSARDQSKPAGKSADFMTRGFEIPAAGGSKR